MFRQSFSLFLHLSEEPREVHADDVLKSEKALRYYSCFRNRQFQIRGNNRQQCLRSTVYPLFKQKVYISIERGQLFDYPYRGVWRYLKVDNGQQFPRFFHCSILKDNANSEGNRMKRMRIVYHECTFTTYSRKIGRSHG